MTTADTPQSQPQTPEDTILAYGFLGVCGTTGIKAAARPVQGADVPGVEVNQANQEFLHLLIFCQCPVRLCINTLFLLRGGGLRDTTTTSSPDNNCLCCRKLSRNCRFNLLRSAASLIFFRDMASPSLAY